MQVEQRFDLRKMNFNEGILQVTEMWELHLAHGAIKQAGPGSVTTPLHDGEKQTRHSNIAYKTPTSWDLSTRLTASTNIAVCFCAIHTVHILIINTSAYLYT
jgi:hypothetical protein